MGPRGKTRNHRPRIVRGGCICRGPPLYVLYNSSTRQPAAVRHCPCPHVSRVSPRVDRPRPREKRDLAADLTAWSCRVAAGEAINRNRRGNIGYRDVRRACCIHPQVEVCFALIAVPHRPRAIASLIEPRSEPGTLRRARLPRSRGTLRPATRVCGPQGIWESLVPWFVSEGSSRACGPAAP